MTVTCPALDCVPGTPYEGKKNDIYKENPGNYMFPLKKNLWNDSFKLGHNMLIFPSKSKPRSTAFFS